MKFTVADLLDQLSITEPLPLSNLEKALALESEGERQQLRIGLDALTRLAVVAESEAGLQRLDHPDLVEARLRCSSKGFCFAIRDDGGEDIYIRDHQLNHAWNGDRVLVKVTPGGGPSPLPRGGRPVHPRQGHHQPAGPGRGAGRGASVGRAPRRPAAHQH